MSFATIAAFVEGRCDAAASEDSLQRDLGLEEQLRAAPAPRHARAASTLFDYLSMLCDKGVSYIVAGAETVDLPKAMDLLGERFCIRTLLVKGGGHINGGFLEAGLVDEVSLLLVPGIDGRREVASTFEGTELASGQAVALKLRSVEQRAGGILWPRYEVARR